MKLYKVEYVSGGTDLLGEQTAADALSLGQLASAKLYDPLDMVPAPVEIKLNGTGYYISKFGFYALVKDIIAVSGKIPAIKFLRSQFDSMGLREAKILVEAIEAVGEKG